VEIINTPVLTTAYNVVCGKCRGQIHSQFTKNSSTSQWVCENCGIVHTVIHLSVMAGME